MPFTCKACGTKVSRIGILQHLQRSPDTRCQDYLAELVSKLTEIESDQGSRTDDDSDQDVSQYKDELESETDSEASVYRDTRPIFGPASAHHAGLSDNLEPPAVEPQGDFFGDYMDYDPDDFGMDLDDPAAGGSSNADDADSDSEEDSDPDNTGYQSETDQMEVEADDAELEGGMELDRSEPPELIVDHESDDNPPAVNRDQAERPLKNQPVIVPFGGKAGLPMQNANHSAVTQESHNNQYSASLGDTNNIYAPFSSRLEWEIASWAKLRGPSSTAFSELMDIEGVSMIF